MSEHLQQGLHGGFREETRTLSHQSLPCQWKMLYRREMGVHMPRQSEEFHPQAVKGLFLAVVNQAIFDVLENGKEAKEAEQWLLNRDFGRLEELFG
jgi:hypothetical protein